MKAQDLIAHHDPPLIALGGRKRLESDVEPLGPCGQLDDQVEGVIRIAVPAAIGPTGLKPQPGEPIDRAARRMVGGQPFGQREHDPVFIAANRKRLLGPEDGPRDVGGIDAQLDGLAVCRLLV